MRGGLGDLCLETRGVVESLYPEISRGLGYIGPPKAGGWQTSSLARGSDRTVEE